VGERVAQYLVGAAIGVGASGGVGSGPGADEDLEAAVLGAQRRRASRLQSVSQSAAAAAPAARVRFWSLERNHRPGRSGWRPSLFACGRRAYTRRRFYVFREPASLGPPPPQFYSTMPFRLVLLGG
jgi:hypothetical protein